jgi:hypothetical protein
MELQTSHAAQDGIREYRTTERTRALASISWRIRDLVTQMARHRLGISVLSS